MSKSKYKPKPSFKPKPSSKANLTSKFKKFLRDNKVFIDACNMVAIPVIGIILTLATIVIYKEQLNLAKQQLDLSKQQTELLVAQSAPEFVFVGTTQSDNNQKANVYTFENVGGLARDFDVFIADEVLVSPNLSSGTVDLKDKVKPNFINIVISGRYEQSITEPKSDKQRVSVREKVGSLDLSSFQKSLSTGNEKKLKNTKLGFLFMKRVIVSYTDFQGQKQKKQYIFIPEDKLMYKEGTSEYTAYDFMRKREIDYIYNIDNESDVIIEARRILASYVH
ncbi:hypothetical protein [Clostridium thailandense]|uniref:hypothetical protein n=1 Tax=Clostridium thailandense TaxID=2794346 RepID=UPI0039890E0F